MKRISVDVSAKQRSKLRNGHSVRVKKGEGLILLVHPDRYDLMTKTFQRGKTRTIALSPEEILANKKIEPEQHNYDIEENAIQDPNDLNKVVKLKKPNAIKASVIEGGGLVNEPPSRTPITNTGGSRGYAVRSLSALKDVSKHLEMLGNASGQNYNARINAGLGSLDQNWENGKLSELEFSVGRENQIISNDTAIRGNGLYAGRSVMFGRGHREVSSVNVGGNLLANRRVLPPALQSQQDGAYFIQNAQLNPLFKR
jgi:hypothetical protein